MLRPMFGPELWENRTRFAAEIAARQYIDTPASNGLVLSRIVGLLGSKPSGRNFPYAETVRNGALGSASSPSGGVSAFRTKVLEQLASPQLVRSGASCLPDP
jgi:hypothetical protein